VGIVVGSGALVASTDEGCTAEELNWKLEDGSSTGAEIDDDRRSTLVGPGTGREGSSIGTGTEDERGTLDGSGISVDDVGNAAAVEGRDSATGSTMGSDVGNGTLDVRIEVVDGSA
jgi:hypothetical protein